MSHYETLGIAKDSTANQIKSAYKKKAMKHHPDKGGDVKEFQKIQKAYDVLGDETRRQQYDETGDDAEAQDRSLLDLQILGNLFTQIIDQVGDVDRQDLVLILNDHLHGEITRASQAKKQQEYLIEKLTKILGRLKVAEGKRNLLGEMTEGKILQAQRTIQEIEESIKTVQRIRALLEGFEYEIDTSEPNINVSRSNSFDGRFMSESAFHEMLKRANGG